MEINKRWVFVFAFTLWLSPILVEADYGPGKDAILGTVTATEDADENKNDHANLKPDFIVTSFIEQELGKAATLKIKDISVKRNEYNHAFAYKGWTGAKYEGKMGDIETSKVGFHEAQGHSFFIDWGYKDKKGKAITSGWNYKLSFAHKYPAEGVYTVKVKMVQKGIKHQWYELIERSQATTKPTKVNEWVEVPKWWKNGVNGSGEGDHHKDFDFIKPDMYFEAEPSGSASSAEKPMGIYHRYIHCGEWVKDVDAGKSNTKKVDTWDESQQMPVKFELYTNGYSWICSDPWEDTWKQLWAKLGAKGEITSYYWKGISTKFSTLAKGKYMNLIREPSIGSIPVKLSKVPSSDSQYYFLQDLYKGYKFFTVEREKLQYEDSDVVYTISDVKDPGKTTYVAHTEPSYVEKSLIISIYKPLPPVSGTSFGITLSPTLNNEKRARIVHGIEDKPVTVTLGDIGSHISGKQINLGKYNVWEDSYSISSAGGPNWYQIYRKSWARYNTLTSQYKRYWETKGNGWYRRVSGNNANANPKYNGTNCFQYYYDQYYGDVGLSMTWGDGAKSGGQIIQPHQPQTLVANVITAGNFSHTFNKNGRYNGKVRSSYKNLIYERTRLRRDPKSQYRWNWRWVLHKIPYYIWVWDWGWRRRWTWNSPYRQVAYQRWNRPGWTLIGNIFR